MPIIEDQLNGRIATLLGRLNNRWRVSGENIGAFQGSNRKPDVLITQFGAQPVVVENEYLPAGTLEQDAVGRLGETLNSQVANATGTVNAVVALRSPLALHDCSGLDDVDELLDGNISLEYALYSGPNPQEFSRFPQSGFITGQLRDLAAFIGYAATPQDAAERAAQILEDGVSDAAEILREAANFSDDTRQAIIEQLKQDYSEQTLRIATTILTNALVFHQNLAGQYGVQNLTQLRSRGALTQTAVLNEWDKILDVNYWSIFNIAGHILRNVNPPSSAVAMLQSMSATADELIALGVSQSHDLAGTVFQKLIADRKFLATFYTRPESAALLAHLAIPNDGKWDDPERVKDFRIADFACGTGTLIHAAYRRVCQLHQLTGGDPEQLHAHMMENCLTALDVLPSAVHLTASMLSSSYPAQRYEGTRTVVTQYGKTERGAISLGSLDLLGETGEVRPLIAMNRATTITGTGEEELDLGISMPPVSQSLVIMNPPFTKPDSDWDGQRDETYYAKHFHGLSTDRDTQTRMSALAREYSRGTCAHGYAGLASYFVALSHHMVRKQGTIALVLPMTALQGSSWQKVRQLISRGYRDVTVLTIAADKQDDQSFSADTGMAETMVICRESSGAPSRRGVFVSLLRRPDSEMEATEIARAITTVASNHTISRLESGPLGGALLSIGEERIGEIIDAPLDREAPWSSIGIADFSVAQTAYQMARGKIWLPQMQEQDAATFPLTTVDVAGSVGIQDQNIVGRGSQAGFDLIKSPVSNPTYPMLWNHNAALENHLVVAPDSEGHIKPGKSDRAAEIWATRSHAHHNRDFRFNSQPLAVAFTERQTIGGRAWPNVGFGTPAQDIAYTLWGNSTLGLLLYWWHSSRQQSGRGSMPISAIRTMPTLDVTRLTTEQLALAAAIFADMRDLAFLPANEAYRDNTRKELDYRVLIELLGLPESILEPLDLLRLKWCSEPSVHGGKRTRP